MQRVFSNIFLVILKDLSLKRKIFWLTPLLKDIILFIEKSFNDQFFPTKKLFSCLYAEGIILMYQNVDFNFKNLFHRRKFFLLTPHRIILLCTENFYHSHIPLKRKFFIYLKMLSSDKEQYFTMTKEKIFFFIGQTVKVQ